MEEENKVAFLDVMIIRSTNDTINTTFSENQQTQTFTDIHRFWILKYWPFPVMRYFTWKLELFSNILFMVVDIIGRNLCEVNNYPRKFVQKIITYNLHKKNSRDPNLTEGSNIKEIFINFMKWRTTNVKYSQLIR